MNSPPVVTLRNVPALDRPPRWGLLTLVALSAGNAAVFGYLVLRPAGTEVGTPVRAAAPSSASSATAPATPTAQPTAAVEETPVIAVYGDGYTAGSEAGGMDERNWTALLAAELDAEVRPFAVSMSGYAAQGLTGQTFADLVRQNPVADADLIVVFGSRNDLGSPVSAVAQGATDAYAALGTGAPAAEVLVIGPAWSNDSPPAELRELSRAVRAAATASGATFVDPLEENWLAQPAGLIAGDGISPTDAGHADLAQRVAPVVERLLDGEG